MPARLYVLALGAFALITTELGIIGILPQLSDAFHVSISRAGWLLSGFALAIAVAGPPMTLLFSRVDRKLSLCFVLALFSATNLASAWAPSFGWLLLLRVAPAFFHPVFWSVAMTAAAASVSPERSHRATAIVFTGMSAGIVLGIPLASWLAATLNWQAAFLTFSALSGVALLAHLACLPREPVTKVLAVGAQLRILREPRLWVNLLLQIALTAAAFSLYGYMAAWLGGVTRMTPRTVSFMLLLFGITGIIGTLIAGRMIGRSIDRTVILLAILMTPIWIGLACAGAHPGILITLIACWGLVHAAVVPLCQALVLRAAPDTPEFSNALFNSFGNIGITCGTSLGGIVIARYGIASLPFTSIALLALAVLVFGLERAIASNHARHR